MKQTKNEEKFTKSIIMDGHMEQVHSPIVAAWLEDYQRQREQNDLVRRLSVLQLWRSGKFPYEGESPLTPEQVSKTINEAIHYIMTH